VINNAAALFRVAIDPEIFKVSRFYGVHSALVRINEEPLERKVAAPV
jgi:hypothetical protein